MQQGLAVTVIEGKDLAAHDNTGKSDPYVVLKVGKEKKKTKKIKQTLSPQWNETIYFNEPDLVAQTLKVQVYDWDRFSKNDFMGLVTIPLSEVSVMGEVKKWYPLQKKKPSDKVSGELHLRVRFLASPDKQATNMSAEELRKLAQGQGGLHTSPNVPAPVAALLPPVPPGPSTPATPQQATQIDATPQFPAAHSQPVSFPPHGSGEGEYNDVPYSQPFQQSFHPLQPPLQQQQQYPPQQSQQPKSLPPLPPRAAAGRPTVVVLYDWIAENEGELPEMKTGETVDIVDNSDSVWWLVTRNGVEGYIPSNYVQFKR